MSNIIEVVPVGDKFHVIMNGNVIHKAGNMAAAAITVQKRKREHPDLIQIDGDNHVVAATGEVLEVEEEYSIEQRFKFLEIATTQVAKGTSNSLIVIGQGGLGKTHTILATLKHFGLLSYDDAVAEKAEEAKNASTEEELAGIDLSTISVPKTGTFKMVKGHSSAKGLYRILWENSDGLIVFDDCDSIQKDMTSLNLLKAALETSGEKRIISWQSEGFIDDGLPKSFEFRGRVIFISNLPMSAWNTAVTSRANTINVTMTRKQIIERMRQIILTDTYEPTFSMEDKQFVVELMDEHKEKIHSLNLRNLSKGIHAYADVRDAAYVTYLMTNAK